MFFERYSKKIIEPFAIGVLSESFDSRYAQYSQPIDTDDFDFISLDGLHAVEVVSVIPENELKAYEYEIQLSRGKTNLKTNRIKHAVVKDNGSLLRYYGGSISTIIRSIEETVGKKCMKVKRRKAMHRYDSVDLCLCIQDGGLMDLHSYEIAGFDFAETEFDNIFFITPSYFIRYTNTVGFEEYPRIVRLG